MTLALTERVLSLLEEMGLGCYHEENTTISATHTHCGPGGLSHYPIYNAHPPLSGFHQKNFDCVTDGIIRAIQTAHNTAQPGSLRLAKGRLEGASVNRQPESYLMNPESERAKYTDDVDREMTLLRLEDNQGKAIGCLNWFPVHPTNMGNTCVLINGDNKGYASFLLELEYGVKHHKLSESELFVAGFAQSNEGDVSPNLWGNRDHDPEHDRNRLEVVGARQLIKARQLLLEAASSPPLDAKIVTKHQFVNFGNTELASEWQHYPECGDRTARGCLGMALLTKCFDPIQFILPPEVS